MAAGDILCVDIGGTSTKAGLLGPDGTVSQVNSIPTEPSADIFFEALVMLIARTGLNNGSQPQQIGIAVAGFLDDERSRLIYNPNIPWFENYPVKEYLQERFPGKSIELEVDSNAATLAEYRFGSGRASNRFLCLTAGTGLGVGMTVDGVPVRFAYGCLGDIGHTIVLRDGPLCACGGRGCAEVMVSSNSLVSNYRRLTQIDRDLSLRDVIEASRSGDLDAIAVIETAGEWLGVAAASLANTFFPDRIALAGGLSAAGDHVLISAERVFRETACLLAKSTTTFNLATLGAEATLIGAGWPFWGEN